jgi:hypothetical protein
VLSTVYFFEWRESRGDQFRLGTTYVATSRDFQAKVTFESTQTRSLLKSMKSSIDALGERIESLAAASMERAESEVKVAADVVAGGLSSLEDAGTEVIEEDLPEVPKLPPGTDCRDVLASFTAHDFFSNPAFNPHGKELDRAAQLQASCIVARARGRMEVLESDIDLLVGTKMEEMLAEGLFVDYEKSQERYLQPGVYTSAEPLGGGLMRLYSFMPDAYPELYEMRRELKGIPEKAVRRLMSLAR